MTMFLKFFSGLYQKQKKAFGILRWFLPKSLFARSMIILVVPLILVQIITAFVFFDRNFSTISTRLADALAGDIKAIILLIEANPDTPDQAIGLASSAFQLQVVVDRGAILASRQSIANDTMLARLLSRRLDATLKRPFQVRTSYQDRIATIHIQLAHAVIEITAPRKRLFNSTMVIFLLWMVGSSLILFAIASVFLRNQIKPIIRLAIAADKFGKGQEVSDFSPRGATEVRQAGQAFIQMQKRIKRQIRQRTDMLSGVSHDLRTPLTRLKLQLALMPASEDVQDMQEDVADMGRMVDGYLAFARGEAGEQSTPVSLKKLLIQAATPFYGKNTHLPIQFECHTEQETHDDWVLNLKPQAIKRVFENLVGNAHRYATEVAITAHQYDGLIQIIFDDNGPGIPENERDSVFRPFYRVEASRNQETGGLGLGLTIVRDTVQNHGGTVLLDNAPTGGLRVTLQLPR